MLAETVEPQDLLGFDLLFTAPTEATLPKIVEQTGCKKMLVPYTGWCPPEKVSAAVLQAAQAADVQIILLRLGDETEAQDKIYSALRGLQMQLAQYPVEVVLDTAVGRPADCITDYAAQQNIDLIVLCDNQIGKKRADDLVKVVQTQAPCPLLVIRGN